MSRRSGDHGDGQVDHVPFSCPEASRLLVRRDRAVPTPPGVHPTSIVAIPLAVVPPLQPGGQRVQAGVQQLHPGLRVGRRGGTHSPAGSSIAAPSRLRLWPPGDQDGEGGDDSRLRGTVYSTSQRTSGPVFPAATAVMPSGAKATHRTAPSSQSKQASSLPVAASHSRTVPSWPPETR